MKSLRSVLMAATAIAVPALAHAGGMACAYGAKSGGCPVGSGGSAWLLVAIAVGYWVLTLAARQEKVLRVLGWITGGLIVLVALGGLVCGAVCGRKAMGGACAVGKTAMGHPAGCPGMKAGCPYHMGDAPVEKMGEGAQGMMGEKAR